MMDGFDMEDKSIDYLKGHKTYMEYLAENGYHCALSGKWHMGDNITKKKGFEYYFTIGRGGCHYYDADIFEDGELSISHEYITDTITNRALEYLDRLSGEGAPFYLSVHYTAPHSPWDASEHPKKFRDLYKDCEFKDTQALPIHPWQANNTCPIGDTPEKRREYLTGYYAAISAMDAGVGKIMDWVAAHGLEEDTVLIFTSDNGMNLGQHGIWGKGNGTYPPNMYDSSVKDPDEETNLFGNPEFEEQIRSLKIELEGWFDRYSVPKMDARICGAVGRGQEKMCYEKNAFDQSIELYHRS